MEKIDTTTLPWQLRKLTGLGLMTCKNALKDHNNDLEKAKAFLEKQPNPMSRI